MAMAVAAVQTSGRFLDYLYGREIITLTTSDLSNADVEAAILSRVDAKPGWYGRDRLRESLRGKRVTMAKISLVLEPLLRNKILKFAPETRGLMRVGDGPEVELWPAKAINLADRMGFLKG